MGGKIVFDGLPLINLLGKDHAASDHLHIRVGKLDRDGESAAETLE
jgi:hypothetical protein